MPNNTPGAEDGNIRKMDLTNQICPVAHQMLARALEDVMTIHYGIKDPIASEYRIGEDLRPALQIGFDPETDAEDQQENFDRFAMDIADAMDQLARRDTGNDPQESGPDVVFNPDMNAYHARSVESFIELFETMSRMKGLEWGGAPLSSGPVPINDFTRLQAERILQRKPQLLLAFQNECYQTLNDVYQEVLQADKQPSRPRYSLNEIRRANAPRLDSGARLWMN